MKPGARTEAERLLAETPQVPYGVWTDSESRPGTVIVGIAIRGVGAAAIAIDAAEYDGMALVGLLGP